MPPSGAWWWNIQSASWKVQEFRSCHLWSSWKWIPLFFWGGAQKPLFVRLNITSTWVQLAGCSRPANALFRLRFTSDWQHALYLFLQHNFSETNTALFWRLTPSPCHCTRDLEIKISPLACVRWVADFSLTSAQTPRLCLKCMETCTEH